MVAILFVCLGNICRSPAAEALLRHIATSEHGDTSLHIESCGIGDWHVGQLPDARMRKAGETRGLVMSSRAQQFHSSFLDKFDYILAADHEVLNDLYYFATHPEHKAKIHLMSAFSECYADEEIPDPYYEGRAEFEQVLDMLEDCCRGLLRKLKGGT